MTLEQRENVLQSRKLRSRPWHTPPHPLGGAGDFHLTAACYEHKSIIGHTPERMDSFAEDLLASLEPCQIHAWCLLPNHYHVYITTSDLKQTLATLGRLHGRSSFTWNREEALRGRHIWHSIADRQIRNEAHGWATLNYLHHNPVRHGYVSKWQDWPWSSAREYLSHVGETEALKRWKTYPILDYGSGWDH
ncbi:transposase [Prosthecobacter sp.]|uniref:transposase n=1 Tax=Prosthecobacter sp. TaxID=1965333 RepID=UPI0037851390